MAETQFRVRWPDDTLTTHYCPSHVVKKFLSAGRRYPVDEFVRISREALQTASDRVREHFGYPCGRAFAAIRDIERKAATVPEPGAAIEVEGFDDL